MKRPPLYTVLERTGFRRWFPALYRMELRNLERIPATGAAILVATVKQQRRAGLCERGGNALAQSVGRAGDQDLLLGYRSHQFRAAQRAQPSSTVPGSRSLGSSASISTAPRTTTPRPKVTSPWTTSRSA